MKKIFAAATTLALSLAAAPVQAAPAICEIHEFKTGRKETVGFDLGGPSGEIWLSGPKETFRFTPVGMMGSLPVMQGPWGNRWTVTGTGGAMILTSSGMSIMCMNATNSPWG